MRGKSRFLTVLQRGTLDELRGVPGTFELKMHP